MHHTMREQQTLRMARLYPRRRFSSAGRFWVGYVVALLIGAYLVADWVTRVAS